MTSLPRTHDEQVVGLLAEDECDGHAGVGAAQKGGKRLLRRGLARRAAQPHFLRRYAHDLALRLVVAPRLEEPGKSSVALDEQAARLGRVRGQNFFKRLLVVVLPDNFVHGMPSGRVVALVRVHHSPVNCPAQPLGPDNCSRVFQ